MTTKLNRPKYHAKGLKGIHTTKALDELVVNASLLLLTASHTVPPELYRIVEERQLGPIIIKKAIATKDLTLIDDAIAQWG